MTAWRPLTKGRALHDPVVTAIADRLGRTPAQVMLRWSVEHDVVPLPKSSHGDRIRANAAVFDFTLTATDMAKLDALGQ